MVDVSDELLIRGVLVLTVDLSRRIVKRLCAWPSAAQTS